MYLSGAGRQKILCLFPITDRRGWDSPSGPAISKESLLLKERKEGFQIPRSGEVETSTIAQMQVQKPTKREANGRSQSSCRVGSPVVKTYSCTATMEVLSWEIFMK